jgi:hypothetical protein
LFVVVLLALASFGWALFYAGGLDAITSAYAKYTAARGTSPLSPSTVTSDTAASLTKEQLDGAKYIYAEQIESQENLDKLADGDVRSVDIDSVNVDKDDALVNVTINFADGTSAPGGIRFLRVDGVWYFRTITGLRSEKTGGDADAVGLGRVVPQPIDPDKKLAQVGVIAPDEGVLRTLATQQLVSQPVFRDLMAGEYERYTVGRPVAGPDTFTIPVVIMGSEESTISAEIVLIAKTVESHDRLFLTTFRRK